MKSLVDFLGYKTITLSLEAYEVLKSRKREKESFSDLILRLHDERQEKLSDFIGAWKDRPPEVKEEHRRIIRVMREETFDETLLR